MKKDVKQAIQKIVESIKNKQNDPALFAELNQIIKTSDLKKYGHPKGLG